MRRIINVAVATLGRAAENTEAQEKRRPSAGIADKRVTMHAGANDPRKRIAAATVPEDLPGKRETEAGGDRPGRYPFDAGGEDPHHRRATADATRSDERDYGRVVRKREG